MNLSEDEFNKNYIRLKKKFEYPDNDLRDILLNCNGSYEYAFAYCSEMDIPRKQTVRHKTNQYSYVPESNNEFIFGNPDIQQLHLLFPNMSLERIASIYWDSGNNIHKAANRILGNEVVYIQDEPKIELEYLHIKYSFIPASEVTAVFLRCKNNYTRANETIKEEYDKSIQNHWEELQMFEKRYGRLKHRYVVEEHKRVNTKYTKHTVDLDDGEEPSEPQGYIPYDTVEILNQRHQAQEYLQNANLLRNYRSEQARTNGKYLTGITNAIKRNEALYDETNRETGSKIFRAHNSQSLESLLENGQSIDFHGLQVQEVDQYMNRIISYIQRSGKRYRVSVITGSGNHSKNNFSTIRNRVISLLKKNQLKYELDGGKVIFSYYKCLFLYLFPFWIISYKTS